MDKGHRSEYIIRTLITIVIAESVVHLKYRLVLAYALDRILLSINNRIVAVSLSNIDNIDIIT